MKIDAIKTEYHSLGLTYDYRQDRVEFCRLLKQSWGWQEFSFNLAYKAWVFSNPKILYAIKEAFPETVITEAALGALGSKEQEEAEVSGLMDSLQKIRDEKSSDIEIEGLKGTLYPFQRAGVEFLIASGGRAVLGDDPGLGKTAQTIAFLLKRGHTKTIVICPASLKYTWDAEIYKWSNLSTVVIDSDTDISAIPDSVNVIIINYDLIVRYLDELMQIPFQCLVLDEAHYVKSPTAKRSKAVKLLASKIQDIIMLTGTLVLNRPVEVYNPLSILNPKMFANYYQFAVRYCGAHRTRFGLDVSGATNTDELRQKINRYFLRRTKDEVLKELPPKVRSEIVVSLPNSVQTAYNKAVRDLGLFLKENKGKKDPEIRKTLQAEKLARLNVLRELASTGKVEAAVELIENIISSGQKVIVFSTFNFPLITLKEKFPDSVMVTGATDNEERFEIVKAFQTDPEIKVFLGGIKSAGVGITLTAASNVVFLDYSWTPADHKQAEDRAHRADELTKTHESINIYTLHARNTIDDKLKNMIHLKKGVVAGLLGNDDLDFSEDAGIKMILAEIEASAILEG